MKLNELAKKKIGWIETEPKKNSGIVLSTRIRLARNLYEKPFPGKANKSIQIEVFDRLVDAINEIPQLKNAFIIKLMEYDKIDRRLLMERHLISYEHAVKKEGEPGVIFTQDEKISIMVNEEDHYRIQIISSGLSSTYLWNIISKIDDELNKRLNFAFHKKFGFLTACPTNVGSGLRVSCLMHLPALVLTNEIDKLIHGLQKVNLSARGFYGEGTKPIGDIFQISNSVTLGKSELEIIENFEKIILTITKYEQEARKKLLQKNTRYKLEDKFYRAYGTLLYSKEIDSEEAILHLSRLRLWPEIDENINIEKKEVDQLIFTIQPGHLQEIVNKELTPEERDIIRSKFIKEKLFHMVEEAKDEQIH